LSFNTYTTILIIIILLLIILIIVNCWQTSVVRSFWLIPVILIEISDTLRVLREMSTREHFIIYRSKLVLSLHSDLNILPNLLLLSFLTPRHLHRTVDRVPLGQVFFGESYSVFVHWSISVSRVAIINRLAVKFQHRDRHVIIWGIIVHRGFSIKILQIESASFEFSGSHVNHPHSRVGMDPCMSYLAQAYRCLRLFSHLSFSKCNFSDTRFLSCILA